MIANYPPATQKNGTAHVLLHGLQWSPNIGG